MDVDYSFLQALWFILISVLWLGYFVLEGFDFGVGMLLRKLGHTDSDRRSGWSRRAGPRSPPSRGGTRLSSPGSTSRCS